MKYAVSTLGCKVNQFETQALEKLLAERGFEPADGGDADVVIINTCSVTAESDRKSRQTVRKMQKEHPNTLIAVCGCSSQLHPEAMRALGAKVIFGSGDRQGFADRIYELVSRGEGGEHIDDPFSRKTIEPLSPGPLAGRTRAYLKIEDGCDNFCTYCVIPYARGRVRSLPLQEIERQAAELSERGFRELVITGIEIASYGKDLPSHPTLADAVAAASKAARGSRIRLGSLEPRTVDENFCTVLSGLGNICPHFHLSLQSGSDTVLQRMGRRYDTARFMRSVELLREAFRGCGLTADLICGFPAETDAEHRESLDFIRRCAFSSMHVFPYSRRSGTRADAMQGQLPAAVKLSRAREARLAAAEMKRAFLAEQVGTVQSVLFETTENGSSFGHTGSYCEVCVDEAVGKSTVKSVYITSSDGERLYGTTAY